MGNPTQARNERSAGLLSCASFSNEVPRKGTRAFYAKKVMILYPRIFPSFPGYSIILKFLIQNKRSRDKASTSFAVQLPFISFLCEGETCRPNHLHISSTIHIFAADKQEVQRLAVQECAAGPLHLLITKPVNNCLVIQKHTSKKRRIADNRIYR